jgi:diaminopimelate epimerase
MDFTKMQGIGNDFVMVDAMSLNQDAIDAVVGAAAALCDRRRGVGADGVILALPSDTCDFRMRIINSDGSEAEMCGNGIRCLTAFVRHRKLTAAPSLSFETGAGVIRTEAANSGVRVDMGPPVLDAPAIPVALASGRVVDFPLMVDDREFRITAVSMGNPHAVVFAERLSDELTLDWGARIESHPFFPRRVNVEFIRVNSPSDISMRVYERGCGETQACGTGACAAVVAGVLNGSHNHRVVVHLPGGDLDIEWDGDPRHSVFKTGPARAVFAGEVDLEALVRG